MCRLLLEFGKTSREGGEVPEAMAGAQTQMAGVQEPPGPGTGRPGRATPSRPQGVGGDI